MKTMVVTLFLALAVFTTTAQAGVAVRTIHHGVGNCTKEELDSILDNDRRRRLRSRELACSAWCNFYCEGFPPGQCWLMWPWCKPPCRRQLDEGERRQLDSESDCTLNTNAAEAKYTSAVSGGSLSATCLTHIASRSHECFTMKTAPSNNANEINKFKLWNADSDTVVNDNLVDEGSFCEDDFNFSIEAVGGSSVDDVKFELYGPDGYNYVHTEYYAPYTMFANSGTQVSGQKYKAGIYNLMVTPDEDATKAVALRFVVKASWETECGGSGLPPSGPAPTASSPGTCSASDHQNECTYTSECQSKYPSFGATDCSNSGGKVCYCGDGVVCGCLAASPPASPPAPTPAPPSCSANDHKHECTYTSECQSKYPSFGATDCSNRGGKVCYCGDGVVCGCLVAPTPTPITSFFVDCGSGEENLVSGTYWTDTSGNSIANTGSYSQTVFQSARSGTDFTYTITGFASGVSAHITLGWAELWGGACASGTRQFDVDVNGVSFVADFDVGATAGGCYSAVFETATFAADSGGTFALSFTQGSIQNPLINMIDIQVI